MQGNSPVVMKNLIDTMMTPNAGIATFPSTHVENSMTKPTTKPDLDKVPLEEVKGVRGDVQDTTDVGEEDQVEVEGGGGGSSGCGCGEGARGCGSGGGARGGKVIKGQRR